MTTWTPLSTLGLTVPGGTCSGIRSCSVPLSWWRFRPATNTDDRRVRRYEISGFDLCGAAPYNPASAGKDGCWAILTGRAIFSPASARCDGMQVSCCAACHLPAAMPSHFAQQADDLMRHAQPQRPGHRADTPSRRAHSRSGASCSEKTPPAGIHPRRSVATENIRCFQATGEGAHRLWLGP